MKVPTETEHFTPMQHQLLRMFSSGISESDLAEIKQMLTDYLAKKASEAADKALEGENVDDWNARILGEHMRTSMPRNKA